MESHHIVMHDHTGPHGAEIVWTDDPELPAAWAADHAARGWFGAHDDGDANVTLTTREGRLTFTGRKARRLWPIGPRGGA